MAAAVGVVTQSAVGTGYSDNTMRLEMVLGTVAVSASPATYTTSGIACDLSPLNPISGQPPIYVEVFSNPAAGTARANLYQYAYLPGTSISNGLLQVFTGAAAQTGLTELTGAGAIPAGVSGDTIQVIAYFARGY